MAKIIMNDLVLKVCITGEGGIGKTTMLHRLISGRFMPYARMTIGTDLLTHTVFIGDYRVIFQLWDFAGEKRFRFFLPNYLKGSSAILLCYDLSQYSTFKNLDEWYNLIYNNAEDSMLYLIGTKKDLVDKEHFNGNEFIEKWVNGKNFQRNYECSSVSGENIEDIFKTLASDVIEKRQEKNL